MSLAPATRARGPIFRLTLALALLLPVPEELVRQALALPVVAVGGLRERAGVGGDEAQEDRAIVVAAPSQISRFVARSASISESKEEFEVFLQSLSSETGQSGDLGENAAAVRLANKIILDATCSN